MIYSVKQVISIIFQSCSGWKTFWTPCSCLKIKQGFPLPASVGTGWPGP